MKVYHLRYSALTKVGGEVLPQHRSKTIFYADHPVSIGNCIRNYVYEEFPPMVWFGHQWHCTLEAKIGGTVTLPDGGVLCAYLAEVFDGTD